MNIKKQSSTMINRRDFLKLSSLMIGSGILTNAHAKKIDIEKLFAIKNSSKKLHLYNINSREALNVEYYINGKYNKEGLHQIYKFMADKRSGEVAKIDNGVIESLFNIQKKLNIDEPISILSGYRSVESNSKMAKESKGVSKNSFHTKGMAVDIFVKDMSINHLHDLVADIHTGGIGYYPSSGFVHIDVGPVRNWRG